MASFRFSILVLILIRPGLSAVKDKTEGNSLVINEDRTAFNARHVKARLSELMKKMHVHLSPVLAKHEPFLVETERGIFDDVKITGFGTLRNGANPTMKEVDNQCISLIIPLTMSNMTLNVGTVVVGNAQGDATFTVHDIFFEVDIQVVFHGKTCLDSRIFRIRWLRLLDVSPKLGNCLHFKRDDLSNFFNNDVRKKLNKHFNQQHVLHKLRKKLGFCQNVYGD